jgi:hypothetical protein
LFPLRNGQSRYEIDGPQQERPSLPAPLTVGGLIAQLQRLPLQTRVGKRSPRGFENAFTIAMVSMTTDGQPNPLLVIE